MRTILIFWILPFVIITLSITGCQNTAYKDPLNYSDPDQLVSSAKANITEISTSQLKEMMDNQEMYVLLDVRIPEEHKAGYIMGSVNVPRGFLEFWIARESFWEEEGMYVPLKEDNLILFCRSGNRSALAANTLSKMGYEKVYSLRGGWKAWKEIYPELTHVVPSDALLPATPNVMASEEKDAGGC